MPVIRDRSAPVKRQPPKKAPARTAGRNPGRGPAPTRVGVNPPSAPARTAGRNQGRGPSLVRQAPPRPRPRRQVGKGRGEARQLGRVARRRIRLRLANTQEGMERVARRRIGETQRARVRRASQPMMTERQFERVRPFGDFDAYRAYLAKARNVNVGELIELAPPLSASRVRRLARSEQARLGRVIAKLDSEIPVAIDLRSEFRHMAPEVRAEMVRLIELANEYVGTPYVWGAPFDRSTQRTLSGAQTGFDCSGFIDSLYRATVGFSPGSWTGEMVANGRRVPRGADMQPGDLVFFDNGDGRVRGGLGHVGLYIGGGWYMEAPYSGEVVRFSNLADRSPAEVRRYVR